MSQISNIINTVGGLFCPNLYYNQQNKCLSIEYNSISTYNVTTNTSLAT